MSARSRTSPRTDSAQGIPFQGLRPDHGRVRADGLPLPPAQRARIEHMGREFLADFLGRSLAWHPDDLECLAELATTLTSLGRLEEGLAADERLVRLAPQDPTVHYNLACSLALLGRSEAALEALERSVELGYDDLPHLVDDEDLASLRATPRFAALLERLTRGSGK